MNFGAPLSSKLSGHDRRVMRVMLYETGPSSTHHSLIHLFSKPCTFPPSVLLTSHDIPLIPCPVHACPCCLNPYRECRCQRHRRPPKSGMGITGRQLESNHDENEGTCACSSHA